MKHLGRYILAIIIIVFGTLLIVENLGLASFNLKEIWIYTYPILFIIFGLKWMIERLRRINGSLILGSFFFVFGSLLLLDRFNIIQFLFKDIYKLWPLVIVYIGLTLIVHGRLKGHKTKYYKYKKHHESEKNTYDKYDKKHHQKSSIFSVGDYEFNEPNWKVEPMHFSNLAGDFYFDFTKAYIPEEEIPISLKALAGDIHILIPEEIEFRVNGNVKAGELKVNTKTVSGVNRQLFYETDGYIDAKQKLDFQLNLTAGSIRVDRV